MCTCLIGEIYLVCMIPLPNGCYMIYVGEREIHSKLKFEIVRMKLIMEIPYGDRS